MIPISVVVLSYNKAGDLINNIPPLLSERKYPNEFEIIIVDNNSSDGSIEVLLELQRKYPELILVLNEDNKGVGGGRNSGWSVAQREYIVALDDDTSICVDDIRRIPSLFEKYSEAGILAFRVVHPITGELQNPHGNTPCEVANHHGAGFALRREIYNEIGGNDEEVKYGADELDYAIRVHAQGWKILYIPEITVLHNPPKRDMSTKMYLDAGYIHGNIRLYYKYFPKWMAKKNSYRYITIATCHWLSEYGISSLIRLLKTYLKSKKEGIAKHQSIPIKTILYYGNSHLRPEFGNVPLLVKALKRLRFSLPMQKSVSDATCQPAINPNWFSTGNREKRQKSDISIIILTNNRLSELKRNILILLGECRSEDEFQIIVVDNNSTDGSREFLQQIAVEYPLITLVLNTSNLGVGGGRNSGCVKASRQIIVALDDDTAISAEDLRRIPDLFNKLPETGILAFRIVHPGSGDLQNPHGDLPCLVSNHHGAGFAFRRELYEKIGGINEECDYGGEELDFAIRSHSMGWKIRYSPEITVFHNSAPRSVAVEQWRLERRVYNNVRIFYQYFPIRMATIHSWRYLVPILWLYCNRFMVVQIPKIFFSAAKGVNAGRSAHNPASTDTVRYYADRRLRPDMGNVPLLLKLVRKLLLNGATNT